MLRNLGLLALLALPLSARATPDTADQAYRLAREHYRALKQNPTQRKYRHHWLRVAQGFERVAANYPKSGPAPAALFTAAETLQELSRISLLPEDLNGAIADLQKLRETYPHHRLAPAASLVLAKIEADRRNRPQVAREILRRAIARNPKSDRVPELKLLLKALERESGEQTAARRPALKGTTGGGRSAAEDWKVKAFALAMQQPEVSSEERLPSKPTTARAPNAPRLRDTINLKMDSGGTEADLDDSQGAGAPRVTDGSPPAQPPDGRGVQPGSLEQRLRPLRKSEGEAGYTLPEQLGLKVRRVVVDAGHGGRDTGAIGRGGAREKDVALSIALRLREILTRAGLEVVLTRARDVFVPLEERARLANAARGDLFVSIHCNSAPGRKLRGIETYTLNTASDRYSIRLAARENASSEKRISDLQFILADLATKANTEESIRLAGQVHSSLVGQLRHRNQDVYDLGTKQALFYVLLGARMPAVLVETSFLSNPEEERRLASKAYQSDIAEAIASGVQDFLGSRQTVAKVN